MAIRLATANDAQLAARLLQEFSDSIGGGTVIDPARLARRFQRWPQIQAVDDVAGVYCELKVDETNRQAEFSAAFPRGASRGLIGPVFALCARAAIAHFPARQQADVRLWRVWGTFLHGQDAQRVPDGGQGICKAWVDYFALDGKAVTARKPAGGSLWIAEMPLGDLADHGA